MKLLFIFAVATSVHIGLAKVTNKNGILGYRYRSNDDKHGKSHENETTDGLERKEYEEVDGSNFSGLGSHGKVEQHSNDGLAHLHGHGMRQQDQKPLKNQDETQDDDDDGDDDGRHWHPHDDRHGHEERHHKHHHKPRHKHRNRRYDDEEDYYQDDKDPHAHDTHGAHHHDDHHKVVRRQRRHHHHDYGYDDDDN